MIRRIGGVVVALAGVVLVAGCRTSEEPMEHPAKSDHPQSPDHPKSEHPDHPK